MNVRRLLFISLFSLFAGYAATTLEPARVAAQQPGEDPETLPLLTTAAAVGALSPEQAVLGRPVRITGVVTYVSLVPQLMFVHDETGGVCVSGRRPPDLVRVPVGSRVRVEGQTDSGGPVPVVTGRDREPMKIEILGEAPLPEPRAVEIGQLGMPGMHGDLVEVEGVVRWVRSESQAPAARDALVVGLAQGDDRAEAVLLGRLTGADVPVNIGVGAIVRVRGVFNAATPDRQEAPSMRLLMRSVRDVYVRRPAIESQYLPVVTAESLSGHGPERGTRARVRGVVTLAVAGKGMFVQDETGGAWVEAVPDAAGAQATARAGDRVDVVGFPQRSGWAPTLEDSVWTTEGASPLPRAPLVAVEQAMDGKLAGRLVRVEALVLAVSRLAEGTTLVLQSGDRVFLARFIGAAGSGAGGPSAPAVREGSWVRATGVCVNNRVANALATPRTADVAPAAAADATPATAPAAAHSPQAVWFHLLLGAPDAVEVITAPGWWTLRRMLTASGALAAVTVAAVAWVVALRRRVARQTGLIREHLARETLYEERVRIARDLHDSLEQDLLGITLQLNATEKLLSQPEQARRSLHLAAAMVRRSQAETHRAVWDLRDVRSRDDAGDGLVAALRDAVSGLVHRHPDVGNNGNGTESNRVQSDPPASPPHIDVRVSGPPRPLPPQTENHLLRVAMEAVTNAVKHAGATRIDVELEFDPAAVRLRVADDGRGFDPATLPPPSSGHFGVFGMRERAEKLDARLQIHSRPREGTEIRLEVPAPATN